MDTPLSGMFSVPVPEKSGRHKFAEGLMAFSRGLGGRGAEYVQSIRERDAGLSMERQQAMVQDALAVDSLLAESNVEDAMSLMNRRFNLIKELGGDPTDTVEVMQLVAQGRVPEARQLIGGFLGQAEAAGIYQRPQPEVADSPASVQEYQYFQSLSPEQQQQYLIMKRANPAINLGDRAVIADPTNPAGAPIAQFSMGIPPAQTPETAGQRQAAIEQAEISAMAPRAEEERAATRAAERGMRAGAIETKADQTQLLNEITEQAKDLSNFWTTGFIGGAASRVEGTQAFNLARTLDTLQATAGFDTLQEMRNNSPTGGALGSVTERELALLQATWGSLNQAQSQDQFERSLDRFQRQVRTSWDRVNRAYERDYGQPYFPDSRESTQGGAAPSSSGRFVIEVLP
jgi:hypothetical protein